MVHANASLADVSECMETGNRLPKHSLAVGNELKTNKRRAFVFQFYSSRRMMELAECNARKLSFSCYSNRN